MHQLFAPGSISLSFESLSGRDETFSDLASATISSGIDGRISRRIATRAIRPREDIPRCSLERILAVLAAIIAGVKTIVSAFAGCARVHTSVVPFRMPPCYEYPTGCLNETIHRGKLLNDRFFVAVEFIDAGVERLFATSTLTPLEFSRRPSRKAISSRFLSVHATVPPPRHPRFR